jgi:hypothetical protein
MIILSNNLIKMGYFLGEGERAVWKRGIRVIMGRGNWE